MKKKIIIGGVPEHFNLPWHLAIESNKFYDKGIDLNWVDIHGGTGAMCKSLRDKSIDIAIVLTEGIIKDIINGNACKLVKFFVKSPLLWGIHVGYKSKYTCVKELEKAKIAISRYGSGSHLMAVINAKTEGFDVKNLDFEIIKNLKGGIESLKNNTTAYFLWEHFTTNPYVYDKSVRRIGNIKSPWPCFVIAVRNEILESDKNTIKTILKVINKQLKTFENSLENKELSVLFSERYNLKINDIKDWLTITQWCRGKSISKEEINSIQQKLKQFSVIENTVDATDLIKNLFD
ncbi:MAG: substrate-binding domain-containing protein [Flavobacteriaceae bacterium]|nr:substrate-binding domain-containing protein [Flavobacteriaceae bacterium]